ncbi:hypothetical protein [Burkholderia cepacia]|uniref:hypothetical protein n=1 Tax=Burkholderia cepacia TaxID=292 RepID=UPI00158E6E78|nr:hypothetical protein [Burkholderia cepacia]MCA8162016.1 hypothetical protein [Burkholderia cepacia]
MDKRSLVTAVDYAWEDLGNAAVFVKMAAQAYVDAAQRTLDAFDEVQRQLTSIIVQNLNVEQAGHVMAELRKHPAGQLTVAFAHDTQLQVMLKSANEGKMAYRSARDAWHHAVEAANAEGCDPTERFSQPDEVVDADQAIEAEAQITEKIDALRSAIEKGAQHVDKVIQDKQQSASIEPETTVPQAAPAEGAAPITEPVVDGETEDPMAMLDGMTGDGAAAAPAVQTVATAPVQPAPIVDDIEEDESLPPPNAGMDSPRPEPEPVVADAPTVDKPARELSPAAQRLTDQLVSDGLASSQAVVAFDNPAQATVPDLAGRARAAAKSLTASLQNYVTEVQRPDPVQVRDAQELLDDAEHIIAHEEQQHAVRPLVDRATSQLTKLSATAEAYQDARTTAGRAAAADLYRGLVDDLLRTHAELAATGHADPTFLTYLGEAVDEAGQNLAKIANVAHVAAVAPEKDAHDLAWAPPTERGNMVRFVKPAGIGLAALLVVIAGVWIGSSGGASPSPQVAAPVIAPTTVQAPAAVPVAPPASSVSTIPRTTPPARPSVQAPPPPVVGRTAAPTVHRPPAVRHVDNLAREQALLNAANAKLDAWAQQHDH